MKRDSRGSTGKSGVLTSNDILPVQRYKCNHCVLIFASKLELLEHLGKDHDLDVDKAIRNAGKSGHLTSNRILSVQRYKCNHCVLIFASKLELLEHMGKEHTVNVEDAIRNAGKQSPLTSYPIQRFQCSHCILIFESKLVLLEHLGKEHGLDVHKAIRNATLSATEDAIPNKKPSNYIAVEKGASALQPEENKLTPDIMSKVKVNKPVAIEKSNPPAMPTSKNKRVSNLAGSVKGSQETSRKITQYFTAYSGQNVKSSSFSRVTSPDPTNTAKKTLILLKSNPATNPSNGCASPLKSSGPPCDFDIPLIIDRTKRVLERDSVTPAKKPKHGSVKITLPTCTTRKSHFPDSSTVTLELSNGAEDHQLPKEGINSKHNENSDISPPKQMEDNPSKKCSTSKSVRADLKCDSCTYGHKSVVAMFVHYQVQHPKIVITLDQIRQTRALVSNTKPLLPETSSEDLNMDAPNQDEKPTDPSEENSSSGSSERTKVQSESLPEEITSAVNPPDSPDTPSQGQRPLVDPPGSPCSVRSVRIPTPIPSSQKSQRGTSTSPPGVKPCSAAEESEAEESPVISRPRISKKLAHGRLTPLEHEDPVQKEPCAGGKAPASPADKLKDRGHGDAKEAEELVIRRSSVKNLFFCPLCNYGKCGLRLVLVHFKNKHKGFQTTAQTISNYTASIHRQMKKSKSPNDNITVLSSGLPVPILQDEDFFFCPLCNYGNQLLSRVMDHQNKSHPDVPRDPKRSKRQILEYTAEVYEQPREEQFKFEALRRPPDLSLGERKIVPFICHKCDYATSNAYLLKRHLSKTHQINQSSETILRTAFAKGRIEEGFHCQWCNFSDKKAERVFEHYKEKHKSSVSSLKQIINHFHMAPKDAPSKKPKDPTSPAMRWAQGSGTKKAKTFSCKTCSFKGSSLQGLTKHNLTVHPSSVKGKSSAFDDISSGGDDQNSHALEADGQHKVLDYNRAPQTLEPSPSLSPQSKTSRSYMCRCCSLLFSTWQGLKIHYGMKHFEEWKSQPALFEEEEAEVEGDRMVGNVVYKCPLCVYAHTTRPGVIAHCCARHPTKKVRAEAFERHFAHVPHASNSVTPRSRVRVGGYMCQTCKEVCRSLKKLDLHSMKCRGDSVPCVPKPAAKYALTKQLLSKYQGSQGLMKKGFSKKNQPGLMKCPLCKHVDKSKEALAKHVDACSKSMRDVFKCTVCSYITLSNKYLRQHYRNRHGIDSKAPAMEYTAVSYNCKLCPYVSSKRRYLVCHYTKSHGMDPPEEFKDNKSLECKKCSQMFKSSRGLSAHYTGVHFSQFQMDFEVLYRSAKQHTVAGYACHHCKLEVQTTNELGVHLNLHREQERRTTSSGAVTTSSQCKGKGASPQTSPDPAPDPAPEKGPPGSGAHTCGLCGRWFPSRMGLTVHERRSHADEPAGWRPDPGHTARSKDRFERCTLFRPGSLKAFHCLICAYRTNLLCLLRSHFRKKHPDDLADRSVGPSASVKEEEDSPPAAGDRLAGPQDLQNDPSPEPQPPAKTSKHSVYSEPAEVERQLSHYRSMGPANSMAPLAVEVPGDRLLLCEFCDFSSGHWSSVRRHYMNIHSKKVHRCKDCCFFTGLRRKLDLHKKTGHSSSPAEPPPQKSLRCPLCLYHTTSRDRLVDHVVLHRQERVVPIELRRPKLSRYLVGVVFRCQECTFTCGSAGTLRTHALKHGPVGPYACRLCYFHCPRLSQLEAHLCDKHQVERNHELVGQVNLDHLGAGAGGEEDGDEEDAGSNPREGNEEIIEGCDEVQQQEKQEEQDVTAGPLRTGVQEAQEKQVDDEVGSLRSEEDEERQRSPDVRPKAAPTGSDNECFGRVGFTSKTRPEGEVSELEDRGSVDTPHNHGPTGGPGAEDWQTHRSSLDSEAQRFSTVSESRLLATPPIPDDPRPVDTEPRLSLEVPRDHRRGPGDELGNPEMPILENVYLDHRLPGQGSLQCGEQGGQVPSGGAVDQRPDRDGALGGSEEPETSLAKGASADHSAAAPRLLSEDHGVLSCTYCGRIFSSGAELQGHVKRHQM